MKRQDAREGRPIGPGALLATAGEGEVAKTPAMVSHPPKASMRSTWIDHWDPEDDAFWKTQGRRIARRNLIWSIVAENLGFSIWLVWSVTATRLPKLGFHYATDQLFDLVALPGLVGSVMRFPYALAVPKFGGRNWTVVSALLLFVPTIFLATLVTRPETPYWVMALAAATAGLGGGISPPAWRIFRSSIRIGRRGSLSGSMRRAETSA